MAKSIGVTIDQYDVAISDRYASDRANLDPQFIHGTLFDPAHSEITQTQTPVQLQYHLLFDTHLLVHPWAYFSPPPMYRKRRRAIFSRTLSDRFGWVLPSCGDQENDEESETPSLASEQMEAHKKKIEQLCIEHKFSEEIQQEKQVLLSLLGSIEWISRFLKELHCQKIRYQRG